MIDMVWAEINKVGYCINIKNGKKITMSLTEENQT